MIVYMYDEPSFACLRFNLSRMSYLIRQVLHSLMIVYKPVLASNYHQNFAIDVLLTTYGVFKPSLQYIITVRVFGFPVITAVTRTSVEVNIVYTFTST